MENRKQKLEEALKAVHSKEAIDAIQEEIVKVDAYERKEKRFQEALSNHQKFERYIYEMINGKTCDPINWDSKKCKCTANENFIELDKSGYLPQDIINTRLAFDFYGISTIEEMRELEHIILFAEFYSEKKTLEDKMDAVKLFYDNIFKNK